MRNGIIYRIFSEIDDEDYIGSTWKTKSERLTTHICHNKVLIRKEMSVPRALKHFNNIGWDNVIVEILEEKEYEDVYARLWRERHFIEERNPSLNTMRRPIITEEERVETHNEYNRKRREDPEYKAYMSEYLKKYAEDNKEDLAAKSKEYREKNKDTIKGKRESQEYKDKRNERRRNKVNHCDVCDVDIKGDCTAWKRHCTCAPHLAKLKEKEAEKNSPDIV